MKRTTRATVALAASLGLAVAGSPPVAAGSATSRDVSVARAAGSTTTSTVARTFSSSKRVWNERFNLCIWTTFSGRLSATRYRYPASEGPFWVIDLKKPKISDPRVKVTLRRSCADGAALKARHAADTFRYAGYVYGYTCSYNPSYSVSAPWGVSVGVTPDCGDEKVAGYGDTQQNTRSANTFRLATDGVAVGWDGRDWVYEGHGTAKVCTSVSGFFVLRDTQGSTRTKQVVKAGLPDQCVTAK